MERDDGAWLEVLGLEELGDLLEDLLLLVVVLVGGDEAVADGALELHAVLRALDFLDHHDPEELLHWSRDQGLEEGVVSEQLVGGLALPALQVVEQRVVAVEVDADGVVLDLQEVDLDVRDACNACAAIVSVIDYCFIQRDDSRV